MSKLRLVFLNPLWAQPQPDTGAVLQHHTQHIYNTTVGGHCGQFYFASAELNDCTDLSASFGVCETPAVFLLAALIFQMHYCPWQASCSWTHCDVCCPLRACMCVWSHFSREWTHTNGNMGLAVCPSVPFMFPSGLLNYVHQSEQERERSRSGNRLHVLRCGLRARGTFIRCNNPFLQIHSKSAAFMNCIVFSCCF